MKRFLSMLATLVLLGQSVVTPLVYATDFVNENEGTVPVASVETEVADPVSDESDDNEVTTDVDNPSDDAEESAELEESADTEESVKAEDSDTLEESKITEDAETSEVAETEKVEETVTEETYAEDVEESSIEESVSYGKSFSSTLSQSWREISTNGLMVTAVDSLGAFPEGTEMEVTAIEEDEVFDLVNDAIEANVTKVRAVDITFWHNGEAVEPTQPINVTISALNMSEPQTVVHIDDEENVEEMEADIKGKTADFLAESFSIYAFVETKKLTVNLYNGGEEPVVINVKSASELVESVDHASIVYDPGVTLNSGEVFRGWIAEKANYTTEDAKNGKTIADIRSSLASEFPLSENKTVNFYAMIFNQHTVTYYDENGAVLKTYDGLYQGENAPSYTVNQPYTPKEGENFEGWKDVATNIVYGNGSGLTLDKDYELKVYTKQGNWLVFDENGKGATYIAPKFIYGGDNTVAPADPERFGYTFEGWYTEKYEDNETPDESKEFAFGSKLEEKTTIYAKWTANKKADYTIIVWKQNVKGGDNYDFEEVITINGNVGSNINTVSAQGNGNNRYARINGVNKQYNGFHLKEFDQNVKIVPEGNAVLNVYYDRNEYTLTFQVPGNGNNKWNTVKTIKALYQQPIGDNFPIVGTNGTNYSTSRWDPQSDTPYNQVLVYIDIMPAANVIFHQSTASHSTKNIHYYVEALPGQTPIRTYNGMGFVEYKSIGANYHHFTEAEDYIEIVGFTKGGTIYPPEAYGTTRNNRSYHKLSSVWDNENAEDVYCYYTRNHNPVVYMDGVYVNGDNNPVEGYSSRGQLHDVEGISYGADLSSYNKGGENYYEPTYTGFVFEGWYIDEACTQPYKFTKMPEASLTVYAKWIQSQYRVFLHPNVLTGDTSLDWGSETQATAFRISNGGTVSLPEGRRTSYEFVGWYTDPEFNNAFIDSTKLNDTTVTTSYDQTQSTELDKYGNPTEDTNKDATNNRFWITKKLDLYAKWRSKLDGANGIKLVYVDENGNTIGEDIKQYVADAEFVVLSAPTIEGKQFKYWKVLDKDGGDTTDVTALPGEVFKVDVSWANIQPITCTDKEKENCKEYTVTLRAFYGPIEEEQNTKIEYCSNYDANDTYCVVKDLSQNTEHTVLGTGVLGEKGERTGYKFIGWNTEAKGSGTSYEVGAGVGVNEEEPLPNKLYAQWEVIQYEVTFVDEDGTTVLKEATKYDYGTPVTEIKKPENPTKAATAEYTYTFAGWTPEVVAVTANATYTATYSSTKNKYKVTFVDEDGETVLKEATEYDYGTLAANIVKPTDPENKVKENRVYKFKEWTPEIVDVTADAVYTATYEAGDCDEGFHSEDGKTCESDTKEIETPDVCGELARDSHAYYLTGTQTLTYTEGEGWSKPDCTAVCEPNYREVEENTGVGNDGTDAGNINNDPAEGETNPVEPIFNPTFNGVLDNEIGGVNIPATNGETAENNETTKVNNFKCVIMTNTVTFDPAGGTVAQGVETVVTVNSGEKVEEIATSRNGYTFQGWTLDGQTFDFSTPITQDITLVAQWKSNGGGGGGGGTPDSYKCENLPENAVANNTDKPNKRTDYTYSEDTSKVCTFQCKSGYKWDKENKKCVKTEQPGGGDDDEEIELGGQVSDKCSVEGSNRSAEEIAAYLYACENDITTIRDINKARLGDFLTRAEMAKMVSVFATKELGMKPNTSKDCSNFANSISTYNQEMKDYMVMSCQLELMGIHTVNYEPIPDFMPSKRVSRAEFGTVLSRVLWGNKYEGTNSNYYVNHLNALKENNIITNINPHITEYRAWVFLMLYRSVEAIKVLKAASNESIEHQVNEELQEEGKAETGLVVEYDSGSVVPDMAVVTESGTLATGSVAEVGTGSVVEAQSGDAVPLTGDDISKEVSAETGSTAETETGSTSD